MCYWEEQHWIRTKSIHSAEFFHGMLALGFPLDMIHSMNHNNQYNYLLLLLLLSFFDFANKFANPIVEKAIPYVTYAFFSFDEESRNEFIQNPI